MTAHRGRPVDSGVPGTLLIRITPPLQRPLPPLSGSYLRDATSGPESTGCECCRARLYDLANYEAYNRFDPGIFNFQIPQVP